jgi:hypothetical protein
LIRHRASFSRMPKRARFHRSVSTQFHIRFSLSARASRNRFKPPRDAKRSLQHDKKNKLYCNCNNMYISAYCIYRNLGGDDDGVVGNPAYL